MELHQAQYQIATDRHRFRVLVCGRKFGKTQLAIEEITTLAYSKQDRQIAYLATNYGEARDIVWERLKKRVSPIATDINEARLEIKVKSQDGGVSQIQLKGWESVENLRGREFDFLILDEVQNYPSFWIYWQEVLRPTLTPRKGQALFMGTPKGFNHLYELFQVEKKDSDFKSYKFTSYDNPHVPKEEIDKAKEELEENKFAQEFMADFRKTEGLIYNFDYDPRFNLENYEETLRFPDKTVGGVDFGWVHPAGVIIVKQRGEYIYIVDEWKKIKKTTPEIIQQCKIFDNKHKIRKWYPDPAEPDRIEEMKRAGLFCDETNKDVTFGISVVKGLIKEKRLFIAEHCLETWREFERYMYEEGSEEPVKEDDHLLDALRYAIIGGKMAKVDKWKEMYAGIPFRDKSVEVWRGE